MYKNRLAFNSLALSDRARAFQDECEAYEAVRLANERYMHNDNVFTRNAVIRACDRYQELAFINIKKGF
jgi:hypothetical protein